MNHPNRTPRPDGSAVQPQRARRPAGRQPSRRGDSEVQRVLAYLDSAPAVLVGRGFDLDLLDPGTADVPAAFLTDGTWIWPAAVVHYLRKHGMPPEPDLVAHIRANGFQVPRVDEQTQRAAEATITGAPVPPPLTADEQRELAHLRRRLDEYGAWPQTYNIGEVHHEGWTLDKVGDGWRVCYFERGPSRPQTFDTVHAAAAHLLGVMLMVPSRLHAGSGDRNTRTALADWPIQPLGGDPPLTLFTDKRIIWLLPGHEVVRFGQSTGNLTYDAGTDFPAMSLRVERQEHGPHRFRIERELRVLSGVTVPWHDQPGGGIAYVLPRTIDQHLADGSIVALLGPHGSATPS